MGDNEEVLVALLAVTDAVWLPMRTWAHPGPANVYFARRDFARAGVPWTSGAAGEAARKEAQRLLERLAAAGKLRIFKPRGVKTLGARLTEEGELEARTLCGLPLLDEAMARLATMVRLAESFARPWVSEPALAGVAWGSPGAGKALARLEDELLPALVQGWAESGADCHGRVYYRATPAGREAAWGVQERTPKPSGNLGREAYGIYRERLEEAQGRLATAEPFDGREIGLMPLPVSMGGQAVFLSDLAPGGPADAQVAEAGDRISVYKNSDSRHDEAAGGVGDHGA